MASLGTSAGPGITHKSAPPVPGSHAASRRLKCRQQRRRRGACLPLCSSVQLADGGLDGPSTSTSTSTGTSSLITAAQQFTGFRSGRRRSAASSSSSSGGSSGGASLSSSGGSAASSRGGGGGSGGSGGAALAGYAVRPADNADYWAIADLHCCSFYPKAGFFWFAALRMDRVMALQLGKERQNDGVGRFACLVADGQGMISSSSGGSSGSSDSSSEAAAPAPAPGLPAAIAASQAAAAAQGRVELGPLAGFLVSLFWPAYMRVNYASTYSARGLLGAVVIDTMGEFVPPKNAEMPNGTVRMVPRAGICYLSNLAVAPCKRRAGVGARLVQEAEALAASWGCRSMALHVDPANTAAIEMYTRFGYRKVGDQPEWQRFLEGRPTPLALYMRALPWEARQAAKAAAARAAEAAAAAGEQQQGGAAAA